MYIHVHVYMYVHCIYMYVRHGFESHLSAFSLEKAVSSLVLCHVVLLHSSFFLSECLSIHV